MTAERSQNPGTLTDQLVIHKEKILVIMKIMKDHSSHPTYHQLFAGKQKKKKKIYVANIEIKKEKRRSIMKSPFS